MNKGFYQFFLLGAMSFVCLYLAFSPAVNIPYSNHDSVRYFHKFYNKESDAKDYPMYRYLKDDGRFVGAQLEELVFEHVNHLSDLSRLRFITIIVIALCSSLLIMFARSAGMEDIPAFCIGTAIFTLPGVQGIIFAPYPFVAVAVLLSLLAYLILTNKLIYGMHLVLALVLLEAVFFMYPPATFFFLLPAVFLAVFQNDGKIFKKIWLRDVFLWFLAAVPYYLILRVFLYAQIESTSHEIAFTGGQLLFNIKMFPSLLVPQVFNLWNVYYSQALGISLLIFVAAVIAIDFFTAKKFGWRRLSALLVLFLMINLIWFLFGGYLPRQFVPAQALALTLVYWCGRWIADLGKMKGGLLGRIWPVFLLCIGLVIADQMVTSNVMNDYNELMFVRSRLAQLVDSSTKEIHFVLLKDNSRGYNGLPKVYDNINNSTPDYEMPDLVRVVLNDMASPFELHCMITYSKYGEPYTLYSNSVVIDMNDLVNISVHK